MGKNKRPGISLFFVFCISYCLFAPQTFCEEKLVSKNAVIYFDPKTLEIGDAGQKALDAVFEAVKDKKIECVVLVGYSDSIGSKRYNYSMSQKRAKSVFKYLKAKGITDEGLYIVIPKGGQEYLTDNETPENRAINRQVRVKVNYYDNVIEHPLGAPKNPTLE